jgi:acyl-CoA reductase-like NAD-dependent aldehyde dehydrogenase
MALMDEAVWRGKIYSGGWVEGGGGDAPVTEPATGAELGRTGIATPADVARAAQLAAAAHPAWAATPHTERSALLRRAADLWLANAADIEWWGIRESGKIPPAMGFETHVATQEIYEGLLHVLPGGVQTGEAVVTDPLIRLISFTGSTAAGRRVGEMAARQLKRVHLELGGNSALIVLDDVDLDRAVSAGAWAFTDTRWVTIRSDIATYPF